MYSDYTSRTRAAGTVAETASLRTDINLCAATLGKLEGCSAGEQGIPATDSFQITKNTTELTSITDGVITGTSGATDTAGENLTFTFTPSQEEGAPNMTWSLGDSTLCNNKRGIKDGVFGCGN